MGGFAIPSFVKRMRQNKRYLLLGLRLNRDTDRMVFSDIIFGADKPAGWALIPHPTDKEKRYLDTTQHRDRECRRGGFPHCRAKLERQPGRRMSEHQVAWNDGAPCTGYAGMDGAHREFIAQLAALISASDAEFPALFQALISHTREHFLEEGQLMRESKYQGLGDARKRTPSRAGRTATTQPQPQARSSAVGARLCEGRSCRNGSTRIWR